MENSISIPSHFPFFRFQYVRAELRGQLYPAPLDVTMLVTAPVYMEHDDQHYHWVCLTSNPQHAQPTGWVDGKQKIPHWLVIGLHLWSAGAKPMLCPWSLNLCTPKKVASAPHILLKQQFVWHEGSSHQSSHQSHLTSCLSSTMHSLIHLSLFSFMNSEVMMSLQCVI